MRYYLREQYQASHNAPGQRPGIQTSQGNSDYASPGACSAAQGCITRTQDSNGPVCVSVKQRVPNHPLSRRFTHTSPQSRSVPGHVAPVAVRQDASMTSPQQPPPTRGGEAVASPVLIFATVNLCGPGPPQNIRCKLNMALLTGTVSAPQIKSACMNNPRYSTAHAIVLPYLMTLSLVRGSRDGSVILRH